MSARIEVSSESGVVTLGDATVAVVDRLGLIGCLPMILVAISLFAARSRWLWYLMPLLVVSWLPDLVLKPSQRYRSAAARVASAEQARPHFVISLAPTQRG